MSSSYGDLLSHIRKAHYNHEDLLKGEKLVSEEQISHFFTSKKSKSYYGWLDLLINELLPFPFVAKPIARSHIKYKPISIINSTAYLEKITKHMDLAVAQLLPGKIDLDFDGWSLGHRHYVGNYASFANRALQGYSVRLLALSPMGQES